MHDKYFFDSNIWLYLFLEKGSRKSLIAKQYIEKSVLNNQIVISWQVINEISVNLLKKGFTEQQILAIVEWLNKIATIQDFTQEVLLKASSLREQYSISYWDSLIVAAALEANCQLLYSEDMQDGLKIKSLTIRNIFAKYYICAP
jgi:predicted nucleic acid-binding protein